MKKPDPARWKARSVTAPAAEEAAEAAPRREPPRAPTGRAASAGARRAAEPPEAAADSAPAPAANAAPEPAPRRQRAAGGRACAGPRGARHGRPRSGIPDARLPHREPAPSRRRELQTQTQTPKQKTAAPKAASRRKKPRAPRRRSAASQERAVPRKSDAPEPDHANAPDAPERPRRPARGPQASSRLIITVQIGFLPISASQQSAARSGSARFSSRRRRECRRARPGRASRPISASSAPASPSRISGCLAAGPVVSNQASPSGSPRLVDDDAHRDVAAQRHAHPVAHHAVHRADQHRAVEIDPPGLDVLDDLAARRRSGRPSCRSARRPPRARAPRASSACATGAGARRASGRASAAAPARAWSRGRAGWRGPRRGSARRSSSIVRTPFSLSAFRMRATRDLVAGDGLRREQEGVAPLSARAPGTCPARAAPRPPAARPGCRWRAAADLLARHAVGVVGSSGRREAVEHLGRVRGVAAWCSSPGRARRPPARRAPGLGRASSAARRWRRRSSRRPCPRPRASARRSARSATPPTGRDGARRRWSNRRPAP